MAVRGTTPDYELIIEGYDLTGATVHVTFSEGRLRIDKTGNDLNISVTTETRDGVEVTISTITLSLTQRETLYLQEGAASIQVKWINSDGKVLATEIAAANITRALLDKVVEYVPDN